MLRTSIYRRGRSFVACVLTTVSLVAYRPTPAIAVTSGSKLWARSVSGGGPSALAPDGSALYVTGGDGQRFQTSAYSATGAKLWARAYAGPADGECCVDHGTGVTVSADGGTVFVTGWSSGGPDTRIDYATIAYDAATGHRIWARRFDRGSSDADGSSTSDQDYADAITTAPGGDVLVTGESAVVIGDTVYHDIVTIAYDPTTGVRDWQARYDSGGANVDSPRAIVASQDGSSAYLTGFAGNVAVAVAYDATNGAQRWAELVDASTGSGSGLSVALRPDGAVLYVVGGAGGTGLGTSDWDMMTVAFDTSNGSIAWDRVFAGKAGGYDFGRAVAVTPDGGAVVIVGYSLGATGGYDLTTIRYATADGARIWVRRTPGSTDDMGLTADITVRPDGTSVFVTGQRSRSVGEDFTTLAYSLDGTVRWSARYGSSAYDDPVSLSVGPNGRRVFVSGSGSAVAYAA